MAKINDTTVYPNTTPALTDHVPGTDVSNTTNDANGETVSFLWSAVKDLFKTSYDALYRSIDAPTYRNLLDNGDMTVVQRGTSVTGATATTYATCDRWLYGGSGLGTWTITQAADGPAGFASSFKMECTTAAASPAAAGLVLVSQRLTGRDLQRLKKGTASAKSVTLSKQVKSNKTGTYVCELFDNDNNRHIAATYTISVANTWTPLTLTFVGDTTGAFDNDNAYSFAVNFWLAAGSNYTSGTLATSWAALVAANRAPGQVNLADTVGNFWQVTAVQLEEGAAASAFEHLSVPAQRLRCLPYYRRHTRSVTSELISMGAVRNTTLTEGGFSLDPPMIAAPHTFETSGVAGDYNVVTAGITTACSVVPTMNASTSAQSLLLSFTVASGLTAGQAAQLRFSANAGGYIGVSADL